MHDAKRIYVGSVTLTADEGSYAAQSGPNWLDDFDLDTVRAPFALELRAQDVGAAVTTAGLQAKLQSQPVPPGGSVDSALWTDVNDGSAVETAALTAEGVSRRASSQKVGGKGRVLIKGTSANWQSGVKLDVFIHHE